MLVCDFGPSTTKAFLSSEKNFSGEILSENNKKQISRKRMNDWDKKNQEYLYFQNEFTFGLVFDSLVDTEIFFTFLLQNFVGDILLNIPHRTLKPKYLITVSF
jgi:hypothetical protein